jgi:hypothetical protein
VNLHKTHALLLTASGVQPLLLASLLLMASLLLLKSLLLLALLLVVVASVRVLLCCVVFATSVYPSVTGILLLLAFL